MQSLVENGEELYKYFMDCSRPFMIKRVKKVLIEGVMVKSSVRADVLTNDRQGKITVNGSVRQIVFESMGGGVWLAKVEGFEID